MDSSLWIVLLVQVILIGLNAVFACAEIAVLSVNETKLRKMAEGGNKKARRLLHLTKEPAKFLASIQVAITLSGFLGSAFAADSFSDPLVNWLVDLGVQFPRATLDTVSVVVITLILSYFTLVFGELVPKRVAMQKAEKLALGISGLVSGVSVCFKPIVWFLTVSTNGILRLMGIDPNAMEEQVSEEEILMMVDEGSQTGSIDQEEKEFIRNVFDFDDVNAGDLVTHRTDVVFLYAGDSMEEWNETICSNRFTMYPICQDTPDDVVGMLNTKDYFRLEDKSRENVLAEAVVAPYFVPETIKADTLFRSMKKNHHTIAVVTDEYGGMAGIITLHDLIEELVGELQEDLIADDGDPYITKVSSAAWNLYGNVALDDLADATQTPIPPMGFDTITGLVFHRLGAVPDDGEQQITLELEDLTIHVTQMKDRQVFRGKVSKNAE